MFSLVVIHTTCFKFRWSRWPEAISSRVISSSYLGCTNSFINIRGLVRFCTAVFYNVYNKNIFSITFEEKTKHCINITKPFSMYKNILYKCHNITEILLKVALNTITPPPPYCISNWGKSKKMYLLKKKWQF